MRNFKNFEKQREGEEGLWDVKEGQEEVGEGETEDVGIIGNRQKMEKENVFLLEK